MNLNVRSRRSKQVTAWIVVCIFEIARDAPRELFWASGMKQSSGERAGARKSGNNLGS